MDYGSSRAQLSPVEPHYMDYGRVVEVEGKLSSSLIRTGVPQLLNWESVFPSGQDELPSNRDTRASMRPEVVLEIIGGATLLLHPRWHGVGERKS